MPTRWIARLCLAVALLAVRPAGAQTRPQWWHDAWRYRNIVEIPAQGPGLYSIRLYAGTRARPDGKDIRVVGPHGKAVPCRVMFSSEEGEHLVVFSEIPPEIKKLLEGEELGVVKKEEYAVYFGNPGAPTPPDWHPRAGVILETRPIPQGADVSSWQAASEALRQAATVYGAGYTGKVFEAHNPFGPWSDYVSIYRGDINCPADGIYKFATYSDDASFLLIDDQLIAQWPGTGHNIEEGRFWKYQGAANLRAGKHKFAYVAFSFGGAKRHGAAWFPPGGPMMTIGGQPKEQFAVIPAAAFGGPARATLHECEHFGQAVCADFRPKPVGYLESGDARMVAVEFVSLSTAAKGLISGYSWEFGDGDTSTKRSPVHVYLSPGQYSVQLAVTGTTGASDSFVVNLPVKPLWYDLAFERDKKLRFWDWTKDLPVEQLSTEHLLFFRSYLRDLGRFEKLTADQRRKLFDTCVALDKRRDQLEPSRIYDIAIDLCEYLLDPLDKWQEAESYLQLALAQCGEDEIDRLLSARFRQADLHFYYEGNLTKARRAYAALREEYPAADPKYVRLALIRLGDVRRNEGKIEEASEHYAEAEADPTYAPQAPRAVVEGRYTHDVRSFLREEGKAQQALDTLEEWLWVYPTMRLSGETMELRLKANVLLHEYREVTKQAEVYIGFAEERDHLPNIYVLAAEACIELGEVDKAREYCNKVIEDFKESPAVQDADNILYRLGER